MHEMQKEKENMGALDVDNFIQWLKDHPEKIPAVKEFLKVD